MSTSGDYREHRNLLIDAFIQSTDWRGAERKPLTEDASVRTYDRICLNGKTAVFMNAHLSEADLICRPGMTEEERKAKGYFAARRLGGARIDAFVCITQFLRQHGFAAPEVYAYDATNGFALLSDFGDGQYWSLLQKPNPSERVMYEAATDVLVEFDQLEAPDVLTHNELSWPMLPYDELALLTEVNLLLQWYVERHNGVPITDEVKQSYLTVWKSMRKHLETSKRHMIMRDYHSPNLMWMPEKTGLQRVGVLDYQDNLPGHPAYNLQFLLNDARRDVPEDLQTAMRKRYFDAYKGDREAFDAAYHVYVAANNCRLVGLFCRLMYQDGKKQYMQHMSRVQGYLKKSLQHPACQPLADWFKTYLPNAMKEAA